MAGPLSKIAAKAAKSARVAEPVLPSAQSKANLEKFLEPSKAKMRLYHGTMATEGGKREEALRTLKPSKEGALGSGVYLTPQSEFASTYAGFPARSQLERDIVSEDDFARKSATELLDRMNRGAVESHEVGGNMIPVYAQLRNPLILEGKGDPMIEALVKLGMDEQSASRLVEKAYEDKGYIGKQVENRARAAGYDGLMQYRDGNLNEVVVYNPNAVKSAIGNQGTYDTSKKELSKAGGGLAKAVKAAKASQPFKGVQDVLPAAQREANLDNLLKESAVKKRLYHGTDKDIVSYDRSKLGANPETAHQTSQLGFFLTPSPKEASGYAGKREGANVQPVYASIKNPYVTSWNSIQELDGLDLQQKLKNLGYDGVVIKDKGKPDNYVAFEPTQIKSAIGNRGTYDTTKPEVNKAKGGAVNKPLSSIDGMKEFGDALAKKHEIKLAGGGYLDPGYEMPVVRRAPDTPIDAPQSEPTVIDAAAAILDTQDLSPRRKKPVERPPAEAKPVYQSPANIHAGKIAKALYPKYGEKVSRTIAETLMGGEESLLPFGWGIQELIPFSPYVGYDAGHMIAEGRSANDPLTTGMGALVGIGGAYPIIGPAVRGTKAATQAVGSGLMAAGRAGERLAERVVPPILERGGLPAEALLGLGAGSRSNVIKPKGGNWLTGDVEKQTSAFKSRGPAEADRAWFEKRAEAHPEEYRIAMETIPRTEAINNWIDKKLNKYIKNEMGTPEDPVRALAERDILHFEPQQGGPRAYANREIAGMQTAPTATTPLGINWENLSDVAILGGSYAEHTPLGGFSEDALRKLGGEFAVKNPQAMAYSLSTVGSRDLGFDHLIDELKNALNPNSGLPRSLQWTPKDLEKVTVPQAVERVAKINEWRMKQKAEANEALARNPATVDFKTYDTVPGTNEVNKRGLAWKEIKAPNEPALPKGARFQKLPNGLVQILDELGTPLTIGAKDESHALRVLSREKGRKPLEDALKYEGEVMGHCVGGYCDDVLSGRSKIYSLRDAKGEPHVTIEVGPGKATQDDLLKQPKEIQDEFNNKFDKWLYGIDYRPTPEEIQYKVQSLFENLGIPTSQRIVQIKGKGNRKPDDKYLPFVQDFVRSGKWSDVGDFQNTGLQKVTEGSGIPGFEEWMRVKAQGNVPTIPPGYYTPQELLQFGESSGLKQTHPSVYATWRKKLGLDSGEGKKAGGFIKKHKVGEKV